MSDKQRKKPNEKKKAEHVQIFVGKVQHVDDIEETTWMITFRIKQAPGCWTEYIISNPYHSTEEIWRKLVQGVPGTMVGDYGDGSGIMLDKNQNCQFMVGMSGEMMARSTTAVPHAWVAGPLGAMLDTAVKLGLPFAQS